MASQDPIAESLRLYLREVSADDGDRLFVMFNDPENMRYYGALRTQAQTREWIEYQKNNYVNQGFGKWILIRKSDGETLGHCGFQPVTVDDVSEIELGYFVDRPYWGQGYATEAAQTAILVGKQKFGWIRVISAIDPANKRSIALARRLGMRKQKPVTVQADGCTWNASIYAMDID